MEHPRCKDTVCLFFFFLGIDKKSESTLCPSLMMSKKKKSHQNVTLSLLCTCRWVWFPWPTGFGQISGQEHIDPHSHQGPGHDPPRWVKGKSSLSKISPSMFCRDKTRRGVNGAPGSHAWQTGSPPQEELKGQDRGPWWPSLGRKHPCARTHEWLTLYRAPFQWVYKLTQSVLWKRNQTGSGIWNFSCVSQMY